MKYEKAALTFEEQATQLIDRGLIADHGHLMERLQATNYYRFTSYLYTFRDQADRYLEGTTLEKVWNLYRFDHGLRMLMLDAIETIEVQVRTRSPIILPTRMGRSHIWSPVACRIWTRNGMTLAIGNRNSDCRSGDPEPARDARILSFTSTENMGTAMICRQFG